MIVHSIAVKEQSGKLKITREEKKKKRREDWKNEPEFESHKKNFFSFPDYSSFMETPWQLVQNHEWYVPNISSVSREGNDSDVLPSQDK